MRSKNSENPISELEKTMRRNDPSRRNPEAPASRLRPNSREVRKEPIDAGPRPVSRQQRAYRDLQQGMPLPPPPGPPPGPDSADRNRPNPSAQRWKATGYRDRATSRRRVRLNRRRPNYARIALGIVSVGLALEIVAALFLSPRLAVHEVSVAGNAAIPTAVVVGKAQRWMGTNLFLFPTDRLKGALAQEPTFESVEVRRILPRKVEIRVRERQPWASVRIDREEWWTIDSHLVPFRKAKAPEPGLPRVVLAATGETVAGETAARTAGTVVTPGRKLEARGLAEVRECLDWARGRTDFVLRDITIDRAGKLCFNSDGGTEIRLGSAVDLSKKLKALALVMERYDLSRAAYVNLYACEAPAVMPRDTIATASAKAHSSDRSLSRSLGTEATDRTREHP
ncbi:MAG: FtsQ-type POTRA domain-containing protein [Capsulimonadales bacterium]|nr:FtsQ-type POTRA domain-containing protein [Capsulimonadales bacterium]